MTSLTIDEAAGRREWNLKHAGEFSSKQLTGYKSTIYFQLSIRLYSYLFHGKKKSWGPIVKKRNHLNYFRYSQNKISLLFF